MQDTLPLVKGKGDIWQNITTLDGYLGKVNSPENEYTKGLICRGKCFVVVSSGENRRFYPSRFMGYIGNTMEAHEKMGEIRRRTGKTTRDGKKTNPAISGCLGDLVRPEDDSWNSFEAEYKIFCKKLDIIPGTSKRKFWQPILGLG